jgi:hypothetical protein
VFLCGASQRIVETDGLPLLSGVICGELRVANAEVIPVGADPTMLGALEVGGLVA